MDSIPFGGTEIPHAARHGQKQTKNPTNSPHQRARGWVVGAHAPPLEASPGPEVAPGLVRDSWVIFSRIPCHYLLSSCVPGSFLVVTENGPARENCSSSCRLGYFLWTRAQSWDCWVTGRDRGSAFLWVFLDCLADKLFTPSFRWLNKSSVSASCCTQVNLVLLWGGYRLSLRGTLKTRLGAN